MSGLTFSVCISYVMLDSAYLAYPFYGSTVGGAIRVELRCQAAGASVPYGTDPLGEGPLHEVAKLLALLALA